MSFLSKKLLRLKDYSRPPTYGSRESPVNSIKGEWEELAGAPGSAGDTITGFTYDPNTGTFTITTDTPATFPATLALVTDGTISGAGTTGSPYSVTVVQNSTGVPVGAPAEASKPAVHVDTTNDNIYFWDPVDAVWIGPFSVTAAGLFEYDAGANTRVRATATGITAALVGGVVTVTSALSTYIHALRVRGVTADLAGDQSFSIILDNIPGNTGLADSFLPVPQVMNTAAQVGGGPTTGLPFIYDEGSTPQRQIVAISGNSLQFRAINMDQFSHWQILITF